MLRAVCCLAVCISAAAYAAAQGRAPSAPSKPFEVRTARQISDVIRELEAKEGNQQFDVAAQAGTQMRVAVFHDEKREGDSFEVHDDSDDIYYVLDGTATLELGGTLTGATEISPGEWRSTSAAGARTVKVAKGDLVVVPRGTVHRRTVTGKGFAMILIKVFRSTQP